MLPYYWESTGSRPFVSPVFGYKLHDLPIPTITPLPPFSCCLYYPRDDSLVNPPSAFARLLKASIVEDLQAALEQFSAIAEDVGSGTMAMASDK